MLLDSSALVALALAERPARAILHLLAEASTCAVGAPTLLETAMVLDGRRAAASPGVTSDMALILTRFEIAVLPFGQDHWLAAWGAFLRYGKGRHPAGLNLGGLPHVCRRQALGTAAPLRRP